MQCTVLSTGTNAGETLESRMAKFTQALLTMLGAAFVLATVLGFSAAHAEVVAFEESGANTVFKIDGKVSTPVEALAAAPKHQIEKCTPIKGAMDVNGKSIGAVKCKVVVLMFNPKTGMPKWKTR